MNQLDKYQSVKDFANSKGISTQAIYRQIKRDSLKEADKRKLEVMKLFSFTLVKEK